MLFPEVIEVHRNRGLLLLFGILVALSVFVAALDAKNVAAEISRLWGTDITGGELLSAVAPELLAYFPSGVWDAPVFWQGSDFKFTWIGNQGVSEDERVRGTHTLIHPHAVSSRVFILKKSGDRRARIPDWRLGSRRRVTQTRRWPCSTGC
jgi:hypothetical protein